MAAIPEKLILECPSCDARVTLKRYVPDKRVRCRKCRMVIAVPVVDEYLTEEERQRFVGRARDAAPPPEAQAKVAKLMPLGRLLGTSAVLAVLVVAGGWLLARKASRPPPKPEPEAEVALTNRMLQSRIATFDFPAGMGFEWVYALGADGAAQEERKIVAQAGGPDDPPQFDLAVEGAILGVRITNEGVFVATESRGSVRRSLSPPLPLLRFPLIDGEVWAYSGTCEREGGGAEAWELDFRVSVEVAETAIGRKECFRIDMQGTQGIVKVEEASWYAPGVGLVKRVTTRDGKTEEAKLLRYKQ